jgi:hypothetical protein
MPNFTPQQTNFYSKRGAQPPATGSQSVQSLGAAGVSNKNTPGVSSGAGIRRGQSVPTPNVILNQAAGATTGSTSTFLDSSLSTKNTTTRKSKNVTALSPSFNRLLNSGLIYGANYPGYNAWALGPDNVFTPIASFAEAEENRVIISDQTGLFITGSNPILEPLTATNGVIFPYTPVITTSHRANYEVENLLHTNYATPYYINSSVDGLNIQGRFTTQTPDEALYVVAMMHFFRTATKMFYGASSNKGTPPPVLYLDAHGQFMYDHIPVVIRDFQYSLPNDVNYMSVEVGGSITKVPLDLNVTVDMIPVYSRNKIATEFDLVKFSQGQLLTDGSGAGGGQSGGWL